LFTVRRWLWVLRLPIQAADEDQFLSEGGIVSAVSPERRGREEDEAMTDQQQIDRLIKVLEAYKRLRYPLDLTESDYDILMDALRTKKSLYEYMARMEDDRR
jgi:hypothetical protein